MLYFASARTCVGRSSEDVPLSSASQTLSDLAQILLDRHASVADQLGRILEASAWSVNEQIVPSEQVSVTQLRHGDVVAVIPPVSGG